MVANSISLANMTEEAKRALLAALVRDLSVNTSKPLNVTDYMGEVYIYSAPISAKEMAEKAIREMTPEHKAELARRSSTPENSLSVAEMLNWLEQQDKNRSVEFEQRDQNLALNASH